MNDVRQKLLNNIVEPAADSRSNTTLSGIVLSVNEKANSCSISYVRYDGKKVNKNDVPIMLQNKSFIDWFPSEKDEVLLQEKNNVIYVIGPSFSNYENIRNNNVLKNDIFSGSFTDVLGGFLF